MTSWDNIPYPHKIYSEFINSTDLLQTECFQNSVLYNRQNHYITLNIDVTFDMELEQYSEMEDIRELSVEDLTAQKNAIGEFAYLNKDKFAFNFSNQKTFCGDLMLFNHLSGSTIRYNIGEGLLNFCYADFDFQKGEQTFLKVIKNKAIIPKDVKIIYDRFKFIKSMNAISPIMYSSIYSAAFPVLFNEFTEAAFTDYLGHINLLQSEFLSLLDFCFDENLYPKILADKSPIERFGIYCRLFNRTTLWTNKEQFFVTINNSNYSTLNKTTITNEHEELSNLIGISTAEMETICSIPYSSEFSYQCSSLLEMLRFEFSKMLECNLKLRKCNYCGKYFIAKGNYNGNNCDRITENNMTCQQLSAIKNHKAKTSDSIPWKIYNKYYKRYFARNKAGSIKDSDFKSWQYKATAMRDDCIEEKFDISDFEQWCFDSFPNRNRK